INWGIKTEWGKERGTRNYRSVIRGVAPHVLAVLPGKFSLCFSLAERVAAHLGIRVAGVPPSFPGHVARATVDEYVRSTRHEATVLAHVREGQTALAGLGRPA